jgi:peptide/nickel transport system permease protein
MLKELWWWLSAPILAAVLTVLALYLLSASISQYLDPRTRLQLIAQRT